MDVFISLFSDSQVHFPSSLESKNKTNELHIYVANLWCIPDRKQAHAHMRLQPTFPFSRGLFRV